MEFSNLRVYQPDGTFKTGGLSISGDRIASAEVSADAVDMGGLYAVPGLVDLHFHGCMGRDFCDGTHESIDAITRYEASRGVTANAVAPGFIETDMTNALPEAARSAMAAGIPAYFISCSSLQYPSVSGKNRSIRPPGPESWSGASRASGAGRRR